MKDVSLAYDTMKNGGHGSTHLPPICFVTTSKTSYVSNKGSKLPSTNLRVLMSKEPIDILPFAQSTLGRPIFGSLGRYVVMASCSADDAHLPVLGCETCATLSTFAERIVPWKFTDKNGLSGNRQEQSPLPLWPT